MMRIGLADVVAWTLKHPFSNRGIGIREVAIVFDVSASMYRQYVLTVPVMEI